MENASELSTVLIPTQETETDENSAYHERSLDAQIDIHPNKQLPDLEFLDEFIRFDVTRTGAYCCTGYDISVQYDDYFIYGQSATVCCNFISNTQSLSLTHNNEVFLHINFLSSLACLRKKSRKFEVKLTDESSSFGCIRLENSTAHADNQLEKVSFSTEKIDHNNYAVSSDNGIKIATINVYRGFRGGVSTYGLTFIADASPLNKALLIALTLVMDIREREEEMTCCFLYIPLITTIVILLFVVLPFYLIYD